MQCLVLQRRRLPHEEGVNVEGNVLVEEWDREVQFALRDVDVVVVGQSGSYEHRRRCVDRAGFDDRRPVQARSGKRGACSDVRPARGSDVAAMPFASLRLVAAIVTGGLAAGAPEAGSLGRAFDVVGPSAEGGKLWGLLTSAVNTCRRISLRPADLSTALRRRVQRRAFVLYGDVCRLLPPPSAIRSREEPAWADGEFCWCPPVGQVRSVDAFLECRRDVSEGLFARR